MSKRAGIRLRRAGAVAASAAVNGSGFAPSRHLGFAGVTLALLAGFTGCTSAPAASPHAAAAQPSPAGSAGATTGAFCRTELPQSWKTVIDGADASVKKLGQPGEQLSIQTGSADGSTLFAQVSAGNARSLEMFRDGRRTRVTALASSPGTQGAADEAVQEAAFDGRWLAFAVAHSPSRVNDWTLYLWDSQGHDVPSKIGDSGPAGSSTYSPSVSVRGGKVVWLQSRRNGGAGSDLHIHDIAAGIGRVAYSGAAEHAAVIGDTIVLDGDSSASVPPTGQPADPAKPFPVTTRLVALSLATGAPAPLPQGLVADRPVYFSAGDSLAAWMTGADRGNLMAWSRDSGAVAHVYSAPARKALNAFDWPRVAGKYHVAWEAAEGVHIADLRSGSYVVLADRVTARTWGQVMVVGDKASQAALNTSTLPALPACTRK